MKIIWW